MLLLIDNYDSFTWNLAQYFGELGEDVEVFRNDAIDVQGIETLAPDYIVISPGPCTPNEAGISLDVIKKFAGRVPLLGVCLGHQAIAQMLGGRILRADRVMHGKTSPVFHRDCGVFTGLENPLTATRYHSLVVDPDTLPEALEVTAWTETEAGEREAIMGLRHKQWALEGVQFHPESILTRQGHELLGNFLRQHRDRC